MECAVARVKFTGIGAGGGDEDSASEPERSGDEEEEVRETRRLVAQQNRKGKKSGGFQSMGLSRAVFGGVMKKGYRVPTPIQRKCIPLVMDGKDVVAMARTGSGKTAAFLVPMFEHLKAHSAKIGARAVILSPTRELAMQTLKFAKELSKFTDLRASLILGGDRMEDQFAAIHENPDIVIATPGRFLHLVVEMDLKLATVELVVFDEADRLFEMGFAEQLQEIIRRLPEMRQTLLFSATLPKLLVEFAKAGLKDPVLVRLDVDSKLSDQLSLAFFATRPDDKTAVLLHLLRHAIPAGEQTVIFVPTKHHAEYLKELLQIAGINVTYVYSSLDSTARKINVAKFTGKKVMTMLVTDVAARGIDIPMLDNVINYNFPAKAKLFVHRVGRVARAGRSGTAFSLVSPDEVPYLLDLQLFLGRTLRVAGGGGREGVFGSVPQCLVDDEEEFIQQAHATPADLPSLCQVAKNGLKQYIRSRPLPSPESVKRAKDLPSPLPFHPLFGEKCSDAELDKARILDSIKSYKPSLTIFEVNSTTKTTAKQVMKVKRDYHGGKVVAKRQSRPIKASGVAVGGEEEGSLKERASQEQSTEEDLRGFLMATAPPKSVRNRNTRRDCKDDNYLHYAPPDVYSEKGLSLGSSFDHEAAGAVLDIEGDEGTEIKRSKALVKWDRKRKKFVGESEKESHKRIKTESGTWIHASYKSNAYKEWMDKHKIEGSFAAMGEEPEQADTHTARGRGGSAAAWQRSRGGRRRVRGEEMGEERGSRNEGAWRGRARGRGRGGRGRGRGAKVAVGGLKTTSEILQTRKRKEFQQMRRRQNVKKQRGGTSGGRRSGRGRPR